ncbi:hypothetical protein [Parasporobacterium paucivorans]|uniref:Uncharacterized protein n=1 Tax=Parasporobacterium paucivorans DSM 15970 TaxID=1122934 RepID=A0A1M6FV08_9FIRM|nr:hypothetical protein [Parasporobacterium paucivorans]SHJ01527.1 hypothetical protein SAMN02745691_01209 [Parasporobacterium paucivorans DSM 15970]
MGAIFEKYSGMIIGIIAAIILIGVSVGIGNQFKTSSATQFTNLEGIITEEVSKAELGMN